MPERSTERPAPTNGRAAARRSRILVVDDEENVRITTAAILEQEGYDVGTASDGRAALEMAARSHYDLVLTDLRMEDMDGSTLLHELQQRHPSVVTIVLTGYASIESSIDALRQGVYDYLVKPCMIEDLKRTVGRALDDQRASQMSSALLDAVRRECAQVVLVDITGCTVVDTYTAAHLINTVRSVRLLGAATVVTGVSGHVASDLVKLGVEMEDITTRRRLADGLRLAIELVRQGQNG
jgi:DNA-binding NtrC family response regulator